MKSLGSEATLVLGLIISLAGAVPSIFDCARNPCYDDIFHLAGSIQHLKTQCLSGKMSPNGKTIFISENFVRSNPACGRHATEMESTRSYAPHEYRPVCDCVMEATVPRHCDSNRCYTDLFDAANESVLQLRAQCGTYLDLNVSFPLSTFRSEPQCGTKANNVLIMKREDYLPTCACIRSQYGYIAPASNEVIYRGKVEPHHIDVFLHVVVISKSSLRAQRYKTVGRLESEFQYLVSSIKQTGIIFTVKTIDFTVDSIWATGQNNEDMRKTLHKGDNRDLNVYMIDELSSPENQHAPISKSTKTYCTPPPSTIAWTAERIGEPILDGCIIATGISQPHMAISMQRWIGTCDLITGRCPPKGAWGFISDVHKSLAYYRYIPGPRGATSPLSYIKADRERGAHCENIRCYDEMNTVVSGNLTQECTSGIFNTTEDVIIKLATFPKGYNVQCGQWLGKDYKLNYYLHRRPCDCLTANGTKSRWDFTEEMLLEYKEPVIIDVFIHLVSSFVSSPMAKKYADRAGIKSEFYNLVSFFNQTEKIQFRLKVIDITYNAAWSVGNDSDRMRQALYMGGKRDLNLYYLEVDDLNNMAIHDNKTTVFCTFPYSGWWALLSGSEPEHDGCIVAYGARMGTLATAMQHWFGMHMVVPSTCRENDCGPKFEPEDLDLLVASAALNRVVPYESTESRLRLAQALDI